MKTTKQEPATTTIRGVELTINPAESAYVPKVNNAYYFDEHAADVAMDVNERKNVMLVGHTGSGKTSLVYQLAARTNNSVLRSNLNGQTTIGDFVGLWTVKGGETVWVDGLLPMAMRMGYWLILDEIDFAEPAILAVMNDVLEAGGKLTLKEKGHEIIEPHPNFRIFATANSVGCMQNFRHLYQGTNIMNEAFLDRWRCYVVNYLTKEQEAEVIVNTVPRLKNSKRPQGAQEVATAIATVAAMAREAFVKEEISCTFSLRRVLDWTEQLARHGDVLKAAKHSIFSKISKDDAEVLEGIITRVMIPKKAETADEI